MTLQTSTAARAQNKVCVIESCYKRRHVTRVSVLGKATKSKDKNSRVLAKEDFFLRDEPLTLTCGCDNGSLSFLAKNVIGF